MISRTYKSLIIVLTIGFLFVVFAAWRLAVTSKAETPHLERYLPASTIGFVQVHDLRQQTLHIAESDAWKEFSKTNPTATSLFLIGANHTSVLDASYALALTGVTLKDGKPEPSFALIGECTSDDARRNFERRFLRL